MTVPIHSDDNVVTGRFGATPDLDDREPVIDGGRGLSADYLEAAAGLGFRALPSRHAEISDAYWDTAAFDILRSGFALRLRGTRAGVHVTLKSLDRPGFDDLETQRMEVSGPIEDVSRPLDPAGWPEAVRDTVRAAAGDAPKLLPICVLHQRHERIPLVNGDGGSAPVVAALHIDVVGIFDPRGIAAHDSLQGVTRLRQDFHLAAGSISGFAHATTLVANTLIERKGATTGLLTTAGFRDIVELGNDSRYDMFDLDITFPEPLAPRKIAMPG